MAEKFEYRNPVYNQHGTIDVEWNHPVHGWIPFTTTPDDPMDYGRELYKLALAGGNIAAYVPPEPDPQLGAEASAEAAPLAAALDRIAALEARLAELEAAAKG